MKLNEIDFELIENNLQVFRRKTENPNLTLQYKGDDEWEDSRFNKGNVIIDYILCLEYRIKPEEEAV